MTKIGILGVGGVGGYLGGMLEEAYGRSPDIEIVFITRPGTAAIMREKGLHIITPKEDKIIFPGNIVDDPHSAGALDALLFCTKTYHLDETLPSLEECITEDTLILPLMNGVDGSEHIRQAYPHAKVLEGCIYIVARLLEPGVVKIGSESHSVFLGSDMIDTKRLEWLETLLRQAGVNAKIPEDIRKTVWEKFLFISCIASSTTYFDASIGQVLDTPARKKVLESLLKEFIAVAKAHGIALGPDSFEETLDKMKKLPYEATSSMHGDAKKGGKTEYRSLTEYVSELGHKYDINTGTFDMILAELTERARHRNAGLT